jgi:uncharacterized membrane protein
MTAPDPDQFEMRRLESLSNTIFGVAMTLLANDLPKSEAFKSSPDWGDLYQAYSGRMSSFALSFIIAGVFWISHHRRLARQPYGSRGAVIVNLLFLLSILLLPASNSLDNSYGMSSAVAVLFGLHLTTIAALNAWLWWLVLGSWQHEVVVSLFPIVVLLSGTIVAGIAPQYAGYLWLLAFGTLLFRRVVASPGANG